MDDLISRAAVKQAFIEYKNSMVYLAPLEINRLIDLFQLIKNLPAVDAAPVIRCKDCSYWNDMSETGKNSFCARHSIYRPDGDDDLFYVGPDEYCSGAERE